MEKIIRGSEWHKWDLHVHTPASVLNNQFGTWDSYVTELYKRAIANNISAIGITDYYIPEGFKILKDDYLDSPAKLRSLFSDDEIEQIHKIFVFPNIEFRIKKLLSSEKKTEDWGNKFNYHLLLCDSITAEEIQTDILSQLKIEVDSEIGAEVETRPLTRKNLEEFGKSLKQQHSKFSGSDFFIGACNASIDESALARVLNNNSRFKNKYMLGIPSDEDLSKVSWDSQSHSIRKNLIKQSHFIFSSNAGTIKFMLGNYDKESHVKEFGAVKPCLWGSDSHSIDKLFLPDKNRNTWIKADLNFSGLKQVIYDPESRVKIQEFTPQQKKDYQIIKRARYICKDKTFQSEWINFSVDLTTIIGGKSSGKSLLLYNLAKTNNPEEVSEKLKILGQNLYPNNKNYDFEVEWQNGDICNLSNNSDAKPITYIPQLYINQLAETEGKNELNSLIEKILCQNENFKNMLNIKNGEINDLNKNIVTNLSDLFTCIANHKALKKEVIEIGVKSDIEKEIANLTKQCDDIRKKSGFTEAEQITYEKLLKRKISLEKRKTFLNETANLTNELLASYRIRSTEYISSMISAIIQDVNYDSNSITFSKYISSIEKSLEGQYQFIFDKFSQKIENIPIMLSNITRQEIIVNQSLLPFNSKVKEQSTLKLTNDKLDAENNRLAKFIAKEKELNKNIDKGSSIKEIIKTSYAQLIDCYNYIKSEINAPSNSFDQDIKVESKVSFNEERFVTFLELFDRRVNLTDFLSGLVNNNGDIIFDPDTHCEKIFKIYDKVRMEKELPKFKTNINTDTILTSLFSDYFKINYYIYYKNDEIVQMSPGKKGLVLMSLLLHLSNSNHPILIDQPEDNLDNRTIYDQLKYYIRAKKKDRQIIMVTHNANLVVSTDSECVIVANQSGQQINDENDKYQFEYCFGSLETSSPHRSGKGILNKSSIRDHVCHVLEGGVNAFREREMKYGMKH